MAGGDAQRLESLTSAIVAGSLASGRAGQQQRPAPPRPAAPPPPPLPVRQLQTLRRPASASAEEEAERAGRRAHHPKIRTGRHAHHEGSRGKWREEMTARERKRYEGLWASNRGYLIRPRQQPQPQPQQQQQQQSQRDGRADPAECVANVVVREIWKRSRLPADELAEIWDLVDRRGEGMLGRQEFVVGTWLVDQRLKGRKVPAKVMDSVWGSANGVILKKPRGR
ncbi:Increased rDNA silencing protein 4 [Escovopsis weberi]|uniref:Increased rDNA silencing protein 4 n=1 Tax=Escovopsis weberi TaxID=150374 RepID=A0A0M9VRS4_ESCWE|nr:Increased rDNA silencing protein 4 [Escovopsis weberi]